MNLHPKVVHDESPRAQVTPRAVLQLWYRCSVGNMRIVGTTDMHETCPQKVTVTRLGMAIPADQR